MLGVCFGFASLLLFQQQISVVKTLLRRRVGAVMICGALVLPCLAMDLREDGYHVFPGENIQEALDSAAGNATNKVVKVHAGEYRPRAKRQAMIWFNRSHDGIRLEAVGAVTLTAANPDLSDPKKPAFPAVVNHVVYFGDGVTSNTVLQGFRITGANHFVTDKLTRQMEPDTGIPKNLFFYTDGGGIKIFGRSYPVIREVEITGNYVSPCGAGVSVQHMGNSQSEVLFENCVFSNNRSQVTGAALDLLEGSAARVVNCLFTGNISNTGEDVVAKRVGDIQFTNSGAITIFDKSRATLQNCTFAGNRNGVDDMGGLSTYFNCIFYQDTLDGGLVKAGCYELDLPKGGTVRGCLINGKLLDPFHVISARENTLSSPAPRFDSAYVPAAPEYKSKGFRPVNRPPP
jgi:hypothetical protein